MEFDPLRDEGILYALRLMEAGVTVELHSFPGTFHGSAGLIPTAAVSQRITREMFEALSRGLKVDQPRCSARGKVRDSDGGGVEAAIEVGDPAIAGQRDAPKPSRVVKDGVGGRTPRTPR